ncbi:Heme exporter protein C [Calidithermus terrae]|uniref:Heme exporter protein C n=1 Tax=Calidithermus terrae TaxID=1408545 RepID=A0A399EI91_9DEIN|nr:cytochrome c biogenesis protein CcsA [Calidithermus terrae]RIH83668.1 Heme exporter protein C [Calidithermus terrae]
MKQSKRLDLLTLGSLGLGLLTLGVGAFLAFTAPPATEQGHVYRIIFLHVPSAWVGLVALFIAVAYSVLYLATGKPHYDRVATAVIEVALLFLSLTLLSGMLWGRPTWGVYWTWEPRLTTFAILLVVYIGYFVVRSAIEDPELRGKASAAISILGAINVPITYMSVKWWRSLHQTQTFDLTTGRSNFDAAMLPALLFNIAALTLLFVAFVRIRSLLAERESVKQEMNPQAG